MAATTTNDKVQDDVRGDAEAGGLAQGEVEEQYSIYTAKEKWLIVGMVALAGFYRYVPTFLYNA